MFTTPLRTGSLGEGLRYFGVVLTWIPLLAELLVVRVVLVLLVVREGLEEPQPARLASAHSAPAASSALLIGRRRLRGLVTAMTFAHAGRTPNGWSTAPTQLPALSRAARMKSAFAAV
jgi:hypothetical protein